MVQHVYAHFLDGFVLELIGEKNHSNPAYCRVGLPGCRGQGSREALEARRRALDKTQMYGPLAARADVSSSFCPAVMERFSTMCDELAGLIRQLCGEGDATACVTTV